MKLRCFSRRSPVSKGILHRRPGEQKLERNPEMKSSLNARVQLALAVFLLTSCAYGGETLSGTVKNGTRAKISAGDEVVLLKLGQGMEEAGRTKTDAKGKFSFSVDDPQSPHLI